MANTKANPMTSTMTNTNLIPADLTTHAIRGNMPDCPYGARNVIDGMAFMSELVDVYKLLRQKQPHLIVEPVAFESGHERVEDDRVDDRVGIVDNPYVQESYRTQPRSYVSAIGIRHRGSPCYVATIRPGFDGKTFDGTTVQMLPGVLILSSPRIKTQRRISQAREKFRYCSRRYTSYKSLVKDVLKLELITARDVLLTMVELHTPDLKNFVNAEQRKLNSLLSGFGDCLRGYSSAYGRNAWDATLTFVTEALGAAVRGEVMPVDMFPTLRDTYLKYSADVDDTFGVVDRGTNKQAVMVAKFPTLDRVYCAFVPIGVDVSGVSNLALHATVTSYASVDELPRLMQRKLHTLAVSLSTEKTRGFKEVMGVGVRLTHYDIASDCYGVGVDDVTIVELTQHVGAQ